MKKKKNISLVLSGGGVRGLAHIGLIKVLEQEGFTIKRIAGCSSGAIIGVLYASGKSINEIETFIKSLSFYALPDISFSSSGLLKGKKVLEIVEKFIKVKTFEELKIPLTVNATVLATGEEVVFSSGNLHDALRASMSYPGLLTPHTIDATLYVDGALTNPLPMHGLSKKLPVVISDVTVSLLPIKKNPRITDVLKQSIAILQKELALEKVKTRKYQVVYVEPDVKEWDVFTLRNTKAIIPRGETAMQDHLSALDRLFSTTK